MIRYVLGVYRRRLRHESRFYSSVEVKAGELYDGHVPTSPLQRAILTAGSGVGGILYPQRDDFIAIFGETTGWYALRYLQLKMRLSETGQQILSEKPRITSSTVNLEELRALPRGTLGREYITFMDHYGYSPDGRRKVKYVDDVELAYVMQRYREIHDITHTLLQMPTSVYGEIVVKQFEAVQTGLPLCVLGGSVAPVRLSLSEGVELATTYLPWAVRNGLQCSLLMNLYFERHFEEPIEELRRRWNIVCPPKGSLDTAIWR